MVRVVGGGDGGAGDGDQARCVPGGQGHDERIEAEDLAVEELGAAAQLAQRDPGVVADDSAGPGPQGRKLGDQVKAQAPAAPSGVSHGPECAESSSGTLQGPPPARAPPVPPCLAAPRSPATLPAAGNPAHLKAEVAYCVGSVVSYNLSNIHMHRLDT